jgi:hypothetical protein
MLGVWLKSSALWFRSRIVLVWRRSSPIPTARKCMWRGLGSAARLPVAEVARRGGGRPAVWQRGFAEDGIDGLLREATRKPAKAPEGDATVRRVVALTCAEPPSEATHWTGRAMAKVAGISLRSVQRILAAAPAAAAPYPDLQALARPRVRRQLEDIVATAASPSEIDGEHRAREQDRPRRQPRG